MRIQHIVLASTLAFGPALADANVLYKSIDARGVVTFSDQPPPSTSRILEERAVPSGAPGTNQSSLIVMSNPGSPASPLPAVVGATPEQLLNSDAAVARANAALDEAERALATARRAVGSPLEAMRMQQTRLSLEEDLRLEEHRRNVKLARQALLELLKERRAAMVQAAATAGDGAPRYGELRPLSQRPPFLASR